MTDAPDLENVPAGGELTAREIVQQPELWREVGELVDARRAELDAFLAPTRVDPRARIVLTGAGSSAYAGGVIAPGLTRALHHRIDVVPTTDIVATPETAFAEDVPTLLVSFARSGDSPESVAAVALADRHLSDCRHMVVTCNRDGALARRAAAGPGRRTLALLLPDRANDEAFAMTSSLTSMALAARLALGGGDGTDLAARLASAAEAALRSHGAQIARLAAGADRVVYLGSGALLALARESALKVLELAAGDVDAYAESSLGFRHGPKAIVGERTLAFVYVSTDPLTSAYDEDIVAELRRSLGDERVVAISAADQPAPAWVVPALAGLDDAAAALVLVTFAQRFALAVSLAHDRRPDSPFAGGEVNRVVQGVTIHGL